MDLLGIGSGMDFTSMIDKLMEVERIPLLRIESRKSDYTSRQGIWRELNTRLSALSNSLNSLKLQSDFDKIKAVSSDDKVVTATADGDAVFGDYKITVKQLAKTQKAVSGKITESPNYLDGKITDLITININGKSVVVDGTEEEKTLADVAKAINNTEDIGVRATVIDDQLIIEAQKTNTAINFFDDGETGALVENDFLKDIGLLIPESADPEGDVYVANILQHQQGSSVIVNGITINRDSNLIEDAVSGLRLTLKKESADEVNLSVTREVDGILSKIKAFVEEYKKVQAFIDNQTTFTPGADGKSNVTGKLFGDSTVQGLKSALRSSFTGVVEGLTQKDVVMLSQLGIEVDRSGDVTLDEAKLQKALTENPEQVKEFFTKPETGLTSRMQNFVKGYTQNSGIIDGKLDYYSARIRDADRSIQRLEDRLEMKRESLVRQYAALDKALGTLYSQGDWLAAQLATMYNSK